MSCHSRHEPFDLFLAVAYNIAYRSTDPLHTDQMSSNAAKNLKHRLNRQANQTTGEIRMLIQRLAELKAQAGVIKQRLTRLTKQHAIEKRKAAQMDRVLRRQNVMKRRQNALKRRQNALNASKRQLTGSGIASLANASKRQRR